eukprot:15476064-Alexandrium_andersonii.AAC.1
MGRSAGHLPGIFTWRGVQSAVPNQGIAAICLDPQSARSIMHTGVKRSELELRGFKHGLEIDHEAPE